MKLKQGETLEELGYDNLKIIQNKNLYRFTSDATTLANYLPNLRGKKVVELGSGSGVISIILATKKNADSVVCVELQSELAEMSERSIACNNLQSKITVVNKEMQGISKTIGSHFDTVVCNPPYRRVGAGEKQMTDTLAICRHEVAVTLSEVIETASSLLNYKGSFYMVHQSERIAEICHLMSQNSLEVKEIAFLMPQDGELVSPQLMIVRGVKNGNVGCKVEFRVQNI